MHFFQLCRRGQQGVCDLKKESIRLFESNGQQYWKKVEGEATKNHQHDSEDVLRDGAYILMENNSYGFNPGLYFNLFLSKLNKDTEDLFSRPIRPQKSFKLHENPEVWYEANKVGVKEVAKALPKMCEAAEINRNTNHQLRATHIELLAHNGVSDRDIQSNSGHGNAASIGHYTKPSRKRKLEMAQIVSNGYKQVEPVQSTSKDAARSGPENEPSTSSRSRSFEKLPDENETNENPSNPVLPDDDFDTDELDLQLTQIENNYDKFLKNEQVLKLQEMQIMANFQKRMEESEKRRFEMVKRFKFKKLN